MTTMEVGKKLVELCQAGKFKEAGEQLYAPNVVCIEAMAMPGMPTRTEGKEAVKKKSVEWEKNTTVHSSEVRGPWPHGDKFICIMKIDCTSKAGPMAGKRMTMEEACLYTVKDGKITQEEFFYSM
jgi:ketosteroid isomerase-like protein